jgi:hypothetical protein
MYIGMTKRKFGTPLAGIICLLAASGVTLWYHSTEKHLGATGENLVKNSIAAEYQRYHLARAGLSTVEKAKLLSTIQSMKILSLTARGPNKKLVVRVEVEPTKVQPPGFSNVQYYQLKYSSLTGWTSEGRTTAENYYLSDLNRFYN